MKQHVDGIIRNIGQLVTLDGPPVPRCGPAMQALGIIEDAAVAMHGGRITAAGPEQDIVAAFEASASEIFDAEGGVVLPGFVDPHTHVLFAGSRWREFELRCQGRSYQEIAAAGGGIRSSVRAFRAASDSELKTQTRRRLDRMLALGTTTVEVKTGYGLDTEQELRALRLIDELDREHPVDLVPTFLGAHEFPDEYRNDRDGYVRLITDEMLPRVAEQTKARFCDVFCEEGVFTAEQSRAILQTAHRLGLGLKLHADEFAPVGGSELAAELGAISADHLLEATEQGLMALRRGGVTAVLLPVTSLSLGKGRYAAARKMVQMDIPVALATDCNPGSSMTESMPLVMSMACLELGLSPAEALTAATVNAAHAIGLAGDRGRVAPGLRADLQLLEAPSYVSLMYHLGASHVRRIFKNGCPVALEPVRGMR
jgi:imidazolonepropionase